VKLKVNMPGGAVRGGTLVVVKQMDQDRSIRRKLVPDRRGILEARINELQRMGAGGDRRIRWLSGERGKRDHIEHERDEDESGCSHKGPTTTLCFKS
jgi:hypothetical protein